MDSALTDLITDDRVVIRQRVNDWRQAITLAAEPLVSDGSVSRAYVRSMIRSVETYGPYIVLAPHTALAHARPDGEVYRQAMSLLTLSDPVTFGHEDNDPVSLVFCLAAVDSASHLAALQQFVSLVTDVTRLRLLVAARTVTELQRALRHGHGASTTSPTDTGSHRQRST
ncbi:PTS sugar transporter subunit IIA [Actinomyces sp. 2119]|uniref:Ascorbate-specific PTS system EIIA component n=1 Tax=Actinomyces lilanjuaniae TaxID=2321394 RepID=A0ABM6Z1Q5_9ACTO|nr:MULTISPECIES: PTS sugar transporter subunit IIA [Actinomyces]AYD89048.1 PTS sugar transporter subunit IIA [Actinomyces lilanjuaniae]RJF40510.1 PTS sugar transporter subunit IIA [Actinomyces sp. 2119]RJF41829.1 PTS sugar transporter subunit IIA [Actinomyces sp. 2119]